MPQTTGVLAAQIKHPNKMLQKHTDEALGETNCTDNLPPSPTQQKITGFDNRQGGGLYGTVKHRQEGSVSVSQKQKHPPLSIRFKLISLKNHQLGQVHRNEVLVLT